MTFRLGDIRTCPLPSDSFDLTWTRDAILYLPERLLTWQRVFDVLKRGGQLFITDFCRRREAISADFLTYLEQCHNHLQDIDQYAGSLAEAGFRVTAKEDMTSRFIDSLDKEKENLIKHRTEFLNEFQEADYEYLVERWEKKTRFCREGDFRWGLFSAEKPTL